MSIGVVGLSGSGKSTLGDMLGEQLHLPVVDVGKEFFRPALAKLGMQVQEGDTIPLWLDRRVDERTRLLLGKQVVIVGRLVSWLAREEIEQNILKKDAYFGVGVFCDGKTIAERARSNWNTKKNLPSDTPIPTIEYIRQKMRLRNSNDLKRFNELYNIKDKKELYGRPPNDILVRSDKMSVEQELNLVLANLHKIGFLAK